MALSGGQDDYYSYIYVRGNMDGAATPLTSSRSPFPPSNSTVIRVHSVSSVTDNEPVAGCLGS